MNDNMNDTIIYRPYKTQTWFLVFTISLEIFGFVVAGYYLTCAVAGFFGFAVIGIGCIWLTKALYDSSKRAVFFDKRGLRIVGGSYSEYRDIPWEKLTYACYVRNYRGHLFLILTPNALGYKEAKRFANRGANSSRICVEGVVVIYLDLLQDFLYA